MKRDGPFFDNFLADQLVVRDDPQSTIGYAEEFPPPTNGTYVTGAAYGGRLPAFQIIGTTGQGLPTVAYFSSYGGSGYRPHDVNLANEDSMDYQLLFAPTTGTPPALQQASSPGPNPYAVTATTGGVIRFHHANKYQLITAGEDQEFGPGGQLPRGTLSNSEPDYDNYSNVSGTTKVGSYSDSSSQN